MVRKEDCTHIDQAMKAYAEKHGLKGIKIDYEHTKISFKIDSIVWKCVRVCLSCWCGDMF